MVLTHFCRTFTGIKYAQANLSSKEAEALTASLHIFVKNVDWYEKSGFTLSFNMCILCLLEYFRGSVAQSLEQMFNYFLPRFIPFTCIS